MRSIPSKRSRSFSRLCRAGLFGVLLWCCAGLAAAAVLEQRIVLNPGWNAIWVELDPQVPEIAQVFAGVPVASVWQWIPDQGGAQFIRDPSEGLLNVEGWFAWFPEPRPEAFLSNLFRIQGNTAYLVRLEGTASREIRLRGTPSFRAPRWQSDAFTLTGLAVDPANPPSFAEFFSASSAHLGQPVYTLSSTGQWQRVTASAQTLVQPGRAYWIYTRGNSRYQGRLHVVLDQGESLEYSAALNEIRVVLRNRSGVNGSFQIQRVGGGAIPLAFRNEDPETGEVGWPALQDTLVLDAPANTDVFLTLAVVRREFTADRMEQTLAITDEHGQRVLLQVGGNTTQPIFAAAKASGAAAQSLPGSMAGLWVGEVSVNAVSQAQMAGTVPTPAGRAFDQRFLIHVDSSGQARLLKDVIQMWEDGTTVPSAIDPTLNVVDRPGRFVLITDKNLIGLYSGAANRDGASVGIRYSTVAYDFEGQMLDLGGSFGPGHQLSAAIVIGTHLPTNPFLHRYHPDHDNLDEQFINFRPEAYQVVRNIQLAFTHEDPIGRNPPGWGDSIVGGQFNESITGLHKHAIFTSGLFRLRRISAVPVLNQ